LNYLRHVPLLDLALDLTDRLVVLGIELLIERLDLDQPGLLENVQETDMNEPDSILKLTIRPAQIRKRPIEVVYSPDNLFSPLPCNFGKREVCWLLRK
jgi:hypothetical protein